MATCSYHTLSNIITDYTIKEIDSFLKDHIRAFDETTLELERKYIKRLKPYFKDQEESALKALRKKNKTVADVENIYDAEYWNKRLREEMAPIYDEIILAGGETVMASIAGAFSVLDAGILDMKGNTLDLIVDINKTTMEAIKKALQAGIEAGDSIRLMGLRIQEVFDDAMTYRAEMIARTEVLKNFNGAQYEAYKQNDIDKNQWLATLDNRTRPEHMDSHLQIAAVKKGFNVGGEILRYPGDPDGSAGNIINCRCTTIAIID